MGGLLIGEPKRLRASVWDSLQTLMRQTPRFSTEQTTAMRIYDKRGREITPEKITHKHSGVMRQYEQLIYGCSSDWAHVELPKGKWGTPQTHEIVFVEYVDPNGCASQYWAAWPKGWESEVKAPETEQPESVQKLTLEKINEDATRYAYSFEFDGRKTHRPIIERYESGGRMSGGGWADTSYRGEETTSPEYKEFLDGKIQEYKAGLPDGVLTAALSEQADNGTPGTMEYFQAWKHAMESKYPGHAVSYYYTNKTGNCQYVMGEIEGPEINSNSEKTPL